MDGKAVKPPKGQAQSAPPKPTRQPKANNAVGPAVKTLRVLQASADNSGHARKLRQLKKIAYLRPNAGALRQLSGDEQLLLQRMRLAGRRAI